MRTPQHRAVSAGDSVMTPDGRATVIAIDLDTLTGERDLVMVNSPQLPGYGRYVRMSDVIPLAQ